MEGGMEGGEESFYTSSLCVFSSQNRFLFLLLSCRFTQLCTRKLAKLFLPPSHTHTRCCLVVELMATNVM